MVEKPFRNKENKNKQENQQTSSPTQPKKVESLLIYCAKETINPAAKNRELLKQNFNPTELGLGQPSIREVRNGILITSRSSLGIGNLKKALEQNENHPHNKRTPKAVPPIFNLGGGSPGTQQKTTSSMSSSNTTTSSERLRR